MEENERCKWIFKHIDEVGNKFKCSFEEEIADFEYVDYEDISNTTEYATKAFKRFLICCGFSEYIVDKIQVLDDDEIKYVLTNRGEWTDDHEKAYQTRKC